MKWIEGKLSEYSMEDYSEGIAFHACALVLSPEKLSNPQLSMYKIPETKSYYKSKLLDEGIFFFGGKYRNGKCNDTLRILSLIHI